MVTLRILKCISIIFLGELLFVTITNAEKEVNKSDVLKTINETSAKETGDTFGMQEMLRLNSGVFIKMVESTQFLLKSNSSDEQTEREYSYFKFNGFIKIPQIVVLFFIGIALELDKLQSALRPTGIGISFFCSWILAPVVSFRFNLKIIEFYCKF